MLKTVRTIKELRRAISGFRKAGESVALVPTMGALHDGHLALVRLALKKADRAVVSIFVNPAQFAPNEDLARYPRDEAGDRRKLASVGTDLIWAPAPAEMYPEGFATRIEPGGAAEDLEGEFRPHHFGGVATVCCKLFSAVTPDVAVFGEKDYQQLCVVRQMVRDLNLPLKIAALPTVREKDGLALSSRNAYLTAQERAVAPALHRAIQGIALVAKKGGLVNKAIEAARHDLLAAGFTKVDYIEVRDAETLGPYAAKSGRKGRILAAAWLGKTRLIDNAAV
jgi:pantoate--beta-alanine ligase